MSDEGSPIPTTNKECWEAGRQAGRLAGWLGGWVASTLTNLRRNCLVFLWGLFWFAARLPLTRGPAG